MKKMQQSSVGNYHTWEEYYFEQKRLEQEFKENQALIQKLRAIKDDFGGGE